VRLPAFEYLEPRDRQEALDYLARYSENASILAGGSDLLVRMKQRLVRTSYVISLKHLKDLDGIRPDEDGRLCLGSNTPLVSIIRSPLLQGAYRGLTDAIRRIGAPPIQHYRGTIGGNLCLETRCLYYNQSAFWRSGRPRCQKDGGEICYAEENSDRCRSANVSDGACALMALDAEIVLESREGERSLPIEEFFTGKGESPFARSPDELVTTIRLPAPETAFGSSFRKLTYRSAIDFALVSASAGVKVEAGRIARARIAVGGAGAAPLLLREASEKLLGKSPEDGDAVAETAAQAGRHAAAFMVDNLGATLEYRQKMAAVLVRKAVQEALARAENGNARGRRER